MAVPTPIKFNRDKGCVLNFDPAALSGGLQPPVALLVAPQHGGKQTDEFLAWDRRATVQPRAVALDQEGKIAALDRHPASALLPHFGPGQSARAIGAGCHVAHGACLE